MMTVGEDTLIDVVMINPAGGAVVLGSGDFLQLSARTLRTPTRQIFTARSASIAGGRHRITIAAGSTKALEPQRGEFDLWMVKGGVHTTLIPLSEFELAPGALGNNYT
jgi:hypothetical protein